MGTVVEARGANVSGRAGKGQIHASMASRSVSVLRQPGGVRPSCHGNHHGYGNRSSGSGCHRRSRGSQECRHRIGVSRPHPNTGNYTISQLPVGTYSIDVNVQGFKTYTHTNLAVPAAAVIKEDVALQVGAASEAVTVTGGSYASKRGNRRPGT